MRRVPLSSFDFYARSSYPERFFLFEHANSTWAWRRILWGAFLILAAAIVGGKQHEVITKEMETTKRLNHRLTSSHDDLTVANAKLRDYSTNLEKMVVERTAKLNQSKEAIESLKLKVEETLYKSMDRGVAKLIIDGRLRTEKRQVTVLFSDLCSFTEYSSKQNPEVVVQQLNRYLEIDGSDSLGYNGHTDKHLGDGIMVEFGAPTDFDKQCLLAVLAAAKNARGYLNQLVSVEDARRHLVGTLYFGNDRFKAAIVIPMIGDTVNLAARLEANCPPGAIVIDENTAVSTGDFVDLKTISILGIANKLKGFFGRSSISLKSMDARIFLD